MIRPAPHDATDRKPLEGRLTRAAWYRLAEVLDEDEAGAYLESAGVRHRLG
ncbi:MAG: hypothetical protein AAF499_08530 [Pseudomonadota bacterium]